MDPDDPAKRARHLAELHHAGLGTQKAGLLVALAGTALALMRALWLPEMPRVLPAAAIVAALGIWAIGMIRRVRHHLRHRRG